MNSKIHHKKITDKGKYIIYPGVTCISMVKTSMKHVEELITHSVLSKYYKPLPYNSYHMTVFNMWSGNYDYLMYSKLINDLYLFLHKLQKTTNVNSIPLKIKDIKFDKTLTLLVEIPSEHNKKLIDYIREKSKGICGVDDKGLVFHITLGYLYNTEFDSNDYKKFYMTLDKLWNTLSCKTLNIEFPSVCIFNSMSEYKKFKKT